MTATAFCTQIEFGFDNWPGWFALDDVSVDPIPEPGPKILCGIGLPLLAALRYGLRATTRSRR